MTAAALVPILLFVCVTTGVIAVASLLAPGRDRIADRVRGLAGGAPRSATGLVRRLVRRQLTRVAPALDGESPDRLRLRLAHAGYDAPHAILALRAVRLALILAPLAVAAVAVATGGVSLKRGAVAGPMLAALGMVAPGMWLDSCKRTRQNHLRRGLPDFFDVLVLCIESGMSLQAAWRRVADELRPAYPLLWKELKAVEQEVEIGRPAGDALQRCADRTDLDEVASLASVVRQAERLGTGLARPLRNLSDALRQQRVQRAEEAAQKTATLIMFPTLLFIFPGVFGVLLGPMISQVLNIFAKGK